MVEMFLLRSADAAYRKIKAMLSTLCDPFTRIISPKEYQSFRIGSVGNLQGVGLFINSEPRTGHLVRDLTKQILRPKEVRNLMVLIVNFFKLFWTLITSDDVAGLQEACLTRLNQFELMGRGLFGDVYQTRQKLIRRGKKRGRAKLNDFNIKMHKTIGFILLGKSLALVGGGT